MIERRLHPVPEALEYLGGITKFSLYELINTGKIQRVKIGRRTFITRESLDAYIDSQIEKAGA